MNVVDAAIQAKLEATAALVALMTGGIHARKAPQGTVPPYLVHAKVPTGREDHYTLNRRAFRELRWMVKSVTEGPSSDVGDQARVLVDGALTDQAITVAGHTLMALRRLGDIEYPEDVLGGRTYLHVGSLYGIEVAPA